MSRARRSAESLFVRAASQRPMSRGMARLADLRLPGPLLRGLIRSWIRAYGVDMSEVAEPLDSFRSFNAFFTRRLKDGARPIAQDPGVVVCPADSRLHGIGGVPQDRRIDQVKGRTYSLEALLGSPEEAAAFAGGVHATLYLSPAMYHRVHSPVDGVVRAWRYLPGRLFPVNTLAVRHVEGLFAVNERVAVLMDSPFGPVAVVLVGAANVGRISLAFTDLVTNQGRAGGLTVPPTPIALRRGDELGTFNLGSTVVLLIADPGLRPAGVTPGQILRMGQPLWAKGLESTVDSPQSTVA